jgi:hypothetical protein
MKPLSLIIFLFLFFLLSSQNSDAQIYKNAIGIRLNNTTPIIQSGITYKHFFNHTNAVEAIFSFANGTGICGLYEIHQPLGVENLSLYAGVGGYVGFNHNVSSIGGAGILGVDYKFQTVPIDISIDWKPELNLTPRAYFEPEAVGFSARFTF